MFQNTMIAAAISAALRMMQSQEIDFAPLDALMRH
jgi:hypothetical protein